MSLHTFTLTVFALSLTIFAACGDDSSDTESGSTSTTGTTGTTSTTTSTTGTTGTTTGGDIEGELDERGFRIRTPGTQSVFCDYPDDGFQEDGDATFAETDHICTFDNGTRQGFIYIRATPNACEVGGFSGTPGYDTRVFFSFDGTVTEGEGNYDFGGGHNNDEATIVDPDNPALSIRYYHSSFGFGFRQCHPMDCVQTFENDALVDDGCTTDRTAPVVCVRIQDDGSIPPLEDTFEKCPGDPNAD